MKNNKLFYGIALLILAGVIFFLGASVSRNISYRFGGGHSGKAMTQESISIKGITSLTSSSNCDVEIIPSDDEKVVFDFDKEHTENNSAVKGDELTLDFESVDHDFFNWGNSSGYIHVKVFSKNLKSITQDGVGNVECNSVLTSEELKLINDGVGSMHFNVNVRKLDIQNSGVGSIDIKGSAEYSSIDNSGTGSVKSMELINKSAKVDNSGVGSVEVNATDALELTNSGVGGITYSGSAKITNLNSSGVGSVSKQ